MLSISAAVPRETSDESGRISTGETGSAVNLWYNRSDYAKPEVTTTPLSAGASLQAGVVQALPWSLCQKEVNQDCYRYRDDEDEAA